MIKGEVQPPYALTKESFTESRNILKPGGMLLVNFQGHFYDEEGLPFRSIVETLKAAGFKNTQYHVQNIKERMPILQKMPRILVIFQNLRIRKVIDRY